MLPERVPPPIATSRLRQVRNTIPSQPFDNAKIPSSNLVCIAPETRLVWKGPEYPNLSPGIYVVRGTHVQGPEWLRNYKRWALRIEFALTAEPGSVSAFFNMGDDPAGPKIGRQSRYYKAWVLANGEHPRKGQTMGAETFCEGQFFDVLVESCNRNEDGKPKQESEVYSRVARIISGRRV